jgi:hypothetical protein
VIEFSVVRQAWPLAARAQQPDRVIVTAGGLQRCHRTVALPQQLIFIGNARFGPVVNSHRSSIIAPEGPSFGQAMLRAKSFLSAGISLAVLALHGRAPAADIFVGTPQKVPTGSYYDWTRLYFGGTRRV